MRPRPLVSSLLVAALLAGAPASSRGATPAAKGSGDASTPAADGAAGEAKGTRGGARGAKRPRGAATPAPAPPREEQPLLGPPPPEWEDASWVDVGHAFVERRLFAPILRLDRFFSDERDIEAERSRSFVRWRSEVRFSEETSRPSFTTGVRASLRLPGLHKQLRRLRIVIAGETRDAVSTLFPRDPAAGDPDGLRAEDDDALGSGDAALRYYLWDTLVSHGDADVGFLAALPPGVFGRLRLRFAVPIRRTLLARSAVSGFWRTDTRFGTSAAADLERTLPRHFVARLGGAATLTEVSRGIEWGTELAVLTLIDLRSAAQMGVAMNGMTDAPRRIDRYRVYTRFRRDVYRYWLFLELEPEIAWPWTLERGRHAAWGLALRLEVQFRGGEAPRDRLPPSADEEDEP